MKKPETEPCFNQSPAQGDQKDDEHASNTEAEVKAHGNTPVMVSGPNDNQGGN